ncbi:SOS response-associated peptidase [Kitasatospora sp. LaBMicrA B282]|uniref:SOS response-associated peptidase n=1 Tax=Kitasatospora sp. LaBMicrA B282 TaxID=3420949 RepID=UPI003D0C5711
MCGRFVSTSSPQDLVAELSVTRWDPAVTLAPDYNVAPTANVWAVLERLDKETGEVERQLRALRWGLVPSWAKDPSVGSRMINARVETVHEKPAYRKAFAARRCLLPADGFYEWAQLTAEQTGGKARKQPYFIRPEDPAQKMWLAGLYEFWRDPGRDREDPAAWWTTCTILTTEATDVAGRVHPRMPLALAPADVDGWLDPAHTDPDSLRALLHQPADGRLAAVPVGLAVNNVRNNGPELIVPDPAAPPMP